MLILLVGQFIFVIPVLVVLFAASVPFISLILFLYIVLIVDLFRSEREFQIIVIFAGASHLFFFFVGWFASHLCSVVGFTYSVRATSRFSPFFLHAYVYGSKRAWISASSII